MVPLARTAASTPSGDDATDPARGKKRSARKRAAAPPVEASPVEAPPVEAPPVEAPPVETDPPRKPADGTRHRKPAPGAAEATRAKPGPEGTGHHFPASDPTAEFDRLFAAWRATGDPSLRERLILMHRPLVIFVARRFLDRGEQIEDLVQHGIIALIHALDQFDPSRGLRFATFATPTILGEIRRHFRDRATTIRVPRRMQEMFPIINHRIDALSQELNRSPTYGEIARSLNIDVEEVAEVLELPHTTDLISLDEYVPTEPGTAPLTIADQVGGPDTELEEWMDSTAIKSALGKLPDKQRRVLELAFFHGYSQMEIARAMKVSQMHVSRLQRSALSQLRELMES